MTMKIGRWRIEFRVYRAPRYETTAEWLAAVGITSLRPFQELNHDPPDGPVMRRFPFDEEAA